MFLRLLLLVLLLTGCSDISPSPPPPPSPTPLVFTPLDAALTRGVPPSGAEITTVGYVLVDDGGTRLVDGLSFSAGPAAVPLSDRGAQIWLAIDGASALKGALRSAGDVRYALALARGRLEGPGSYGPGGAYRFRIADPRLDSIAPEETTVADLLDRSAVYEGRIVRIVGELLAQDEAALLVERIGPGGVPDSKARQVKLRAPIRDTSLLERLQGVSGGVRFGRVQVEGFWRNNVLTPLAILPVT